MVPEEFCLNGKIAIVTGAGRGIGKAISLVFAEAGADVVVAARTMTELEQTATEIRNLGRRATAICADVTQPSQVEHMIEQTVLDFGRVDILVNNAGIARPKQIVPLPGVKLPGWQRVRDLNSPLSVEEWHATMDTNLTSVFLCARAVGSIMIKQKRGKVINIGSRNSNTGDPYRVHYNTSKAAVAMFTRCLAVEWAPFNINVNAIAPGAFHTALSDEAFRVPELKAQMIQSIPMHRVGELREVGLLALYLASAASDYMTGQTLYLDGGTTAL